MGLGDRISSWAESWAEGIKDKLRGWFLRSLSEGAERLFDDMEPELLDQIRPQLESLRDNPQLPPQIKDTLEKALSPKSFAFVPILIALLVGMAMSSVMSALGPALRRVTQATDREVESARLDPLTVMRVWLRDKPTWEWLFEDLRDQGFSNERIAVFQELSQFLPGPQDLVMWMAREVFEPDSVARYGLDNEFDRLDLSLFAKVGVSPEQARNYWRAHWQHASWRQVIEMLHRGQLTEEEVSDWFRLVEIPPFWRDKLIATSWNVPTRVDVRRWWDLRTIDEARLREVYEHQGYHGKDLDDYVLWTKVYVAFPDLVARWRNGWITEEDVRTELLTLGMPPDRVEELIQTKIKAARPERTVKERDLTKADIYRGVKNNVIEREQGFELLRDLGYSDFEAEYLLLLNAPLGSDDASAKRRELTKADLKSAVKQQLVTPDEAVERLIALRYAPADAQFLGNLYAGLIPIETVAPQRELTKSDIGKALRKGILGPNESLTLLIDLGYSQDDAEILISANMPPPEAIEVEERRTLAKTDIKAALKVGLITPPQAIERLQTIGYTLEDSEFLGAIYTSLLRLAEATKPKELTKADITKGVKRGLLEPGEGFAMLLEIGYPEAEANYILALSAPKEERSPISFQEFKEMTQKYRRTQGVNAKLPKPELIEAEKEVNTLKARIRTMELEGINEDDIAPVRGELGEAELKLLTTLTSIQEAEREGPPEG